MELTTVWFILIAVLWIGYFVLEGFDFGVGMLLPVIGKTEAERRAMITTLGPVWDGNEVWVLVAGGATFAAFPEWYATLFSGFYLPLFLILVALILRGVAFEYRSKRSDGQWRARWDAAIVVGSFVPALLWGVAFANIVRGVPLEESASTGNIEYAGGFFNLLNPFGLLGGVTFVAIFLTHGAIFLSLKTHGSIRDSAHRIGMRTGAVATVLAVVFLVWAELAFTDKLWTWIPVLAAAASWLVAMFMHAKRSEGWAFVFSALTIALAVISLFGMLFPNVMPGNPGPSLTTGNASSTDYTLTIMTWVAVVFTPIVLMYQGWTYWVFRKRISAEDIVDPEYGSLDHVPS